MTLLTIDTKKWKQNTRICFIYSLPIVSDACQNTQNLVQVGGCGVFPSLRQLRVAVGVLRLLHPGGGRVVAQGAEVAFHRSDFQLQLSHKRAKLSHEKFQFLAFFGARIITPPAYPQFELGPQRGVKQTLPPSRTHSRGPELVSVGQKGKYVHDKLAGQSHGSDTPTQSHGELRKNCQKYTNY